MIVCHMMGYFEGWPTDFVLYAARNEGRTRKPERVPPAEIPRYLHCKSDSEVYGHDPVCDRHGQEQPNDAHHRRLVHHG